MDDLSARKRVAARRQTAAAGAVQRLLPPSRRASDPVETAFSKPNAPLRRAAERNVAGLMAAIGRRADRDAPADRADARTPAGPEPA